MVLLIDDPSQPRDGHHRQLLQQARDLPGEIELLLEGPRQLFQAALTEFANLPESAPIHAAMLEELAANYDSAAQWFRLEATGYQVLDHSDAFLLSEVFQRHIDELNRTAVALREAVAGGHVSAGAGSPSSTAAWYGSSGPSCPASSARPLPPSATRPTRP